MAALISAKNAEIRQMEPFVVRLAEKPVFHFKTFFGLILPYVGKLYIRNLFEGSGVNA